MTVQPAAARWTVSSRLGFIPNTHWQLGRTIDVPLGGTISRYGSTGFYSGILHVLASALVTYFTSINCDFKQHFRTASCYCSRGAQRVLRSGDMEYVMLHLIFSLPHAWGGTTCSVRCLRSLIPENSSGGSLSAPKTICFRQADLRSRPCHANILMLPPSHPRLDGYRECSVAVRHPRWSRTLPQ